jgi:hypothetical protein
MRPRALEPVFRYFDFLSVVMVGVFALSQLLFWYAARGFNFSGGWGVAFILLTVLPIMGVAIGGIYWLGNAIEQKVGELKAR